MVVVAASGSVCVGLGVFKVTELICKLVAVMKENCEPIEVVGKRVADGWNCVVAGTVIVDPEATAEELADGS